MLVTGNTFHGSIEEFPSISIDKFNTLSDIFILTHSHSDHLVGLTNKSFNSVVYCSEMTKKIISDDIKYSDIVHLLRPLEFNRQYNFLIHGNKINIVLIPSYHCAGSSMVLLTGNGKSILFTGDIRAEDWWTSSLRKNSYLYPYTTSLRTLDNIYFDSTFAYRGEPFIEMLSNEDGMEAAAKLISLYPSDDPDVQFFFTDNTLGFDECWASIADLTQGELHTSLKNGNRMKLLEEAGQKPTRTYRQDILAEKMKVFHACGKFPDDCQIKFKPKFSVRIKQCIDFNIRDYVASFVPLLLGTLSSSEKEHNLLLRDETAMGNQIYHFRNRDWILPKNTQELLPADIKLVFSRHSSYSEIKEFISLFTPKQVYPCTESKNTWINGFSMSRVFGSVCLSSSFSYDLKKQVEWGSIPNLNLTRPVTTVNRWSISQCQNEEDFVKGILTRLGGSIREYMHDKLQLLGVGDRGLSKQERKDRKLPKFIEGRREEKFKIFIEEQQRKYNKYFNGPLNNSDIGSDYTDSSLDTRAQSDYHMNSSSSSSSKSSKSRKTQETWSPSPKISSVQRKSRPRLNRIHKPNKIRSKYLDCSFVHSSFNSFEVSMARVSFTGKLSISEAPEKVPSESKTSSQESIYYKTGVLIDYNRVDQVAEELKTNSSNWFGFNLQSTAP
ncbi:hypothetical protein HYPBUDRAFT_103241 [Hyphopichia burtonii NRRL Y-1933]|uniref:Protein artemis n=1 Tax=Hyphopichia burtonii NRRL Y-1933 TaxID=984485 RepID=A0A1E4RQV9_9ASCO|nr:hypothetical protein HYPBUDRAFT_103241 [Hyphopichia burtonii NRRL Y-1933]ODV69591.1 hypothetical protein HYPBUDRAFT_103241 [Hyphopichia burtonii NRRL Y-1933]